MNRRRLLSGSITIAFLALFIWYASNNKDDLSQLKDVAIAGLLLIALGKVLVFISNGLFTKWSAEAFTEKFSIGEGVYISILSAVGNFFGPLLGGTSIRAFYLKKYHNLAYSKFASTLIWYYLILFLLVSAVAIASVLGLSDSKQTESLLVFFSLWLFIVSFFILFKFPLKKDAFQNKNKIIRFISKVLVDIEKGRHIISKDKSLISKLFLVSALSFGASLFVSYVEFTLLNISVSVPALGLYTALVSLSLLISITPGAIGIRESILLIVSSTMGVTASDIIQLAVIDRGVHFLLLIVLFIITRSSKLRHFLTSKEITL